MNYKFIHVANLFCLIAIFLSVYDIYFIKNDYTELSLVCSSIACCLFVMARKTTYQKIVLGTIYIFVLLTTALFYAR